MYHFFQDDVGFSALVSYEKSHLLPLQKLHEDIDRDLTAMELNYLDGKYLLNCSFFALKFLKQLFSILLSPGKREIYGRKM